MSKLKIKPTLFIICYLLLVCILFFATHIQEKEIIKLQSKRIELLKIVNKTNTIIIEELNKIINQQIEKKEKTKEISNATITAFNTVKWQTDSTPCIAKFGYICDRDGVVACPRDIPAYTKVIIFDKEYECMDWMSIKYNGRFDISFDKDIQGAKNFGKKYTKVIVKL